MAPGQDDHSSAESDDGRVLSPDELDISDDEHVHQLDDDRFVVSAGEPIDESRTPAPSESAEDATPEPAPEPETGPTPHRGAGADRAADAPPGPEPEFTAESVHDWLSDRFAENDSRYGFDVTGKFDGSVAQRRMVSNDVVTIFESLVLWYAQQLDKDTPVEEVLGLLLVEANVPIQYPPESIERTLQSAGLSPEDSIADLVEAVREDDGFRL